MRERTAIEMGKRRGCGVCGTIARLWKWAIWLRHDGSARRTKVCPVCLRRAFVFVLSPKGNGERCPFTRADGARCGLPFGHRGACELKLDRDLPGEIAREAEGLATRIARGASELAAAAAEAAPPASPVSAGRALAKKARKATRRLAAHAAEELAAKGKRKKVSAQAPIPEGSECARCKGHGQILVRVKGEQVERPCDAVGCVDGTVH